MDILKAFSLLGDEYSVNIQGTHENPLFKAKDIANILELSNIRENLKDFSSEEKVVSLTYSLGGPQETTFLTEIGLYKIIMRSRKPIANKFQSWVVNVIKEIRLTGMYKLKQDSEIDKQLCDMFMTCDPKTRNALKVAYPEMYNAFLKSERGVYKILKGEDIIEISRESHDYKTI
jgi:prophage antirepressor-like protein